MLLITVTFFFIIIKMELSKLSKNISYLLHSNPVGLGGLEVYIDKKKTGYLIIVQAECCTWKFIILFFLLLHMFEILHIRKSLKFTIQTSLLSFPPPPFNTNGKVNYVNNVFSIKTCPDIHYLQHTSCFLLNSRVSGITQYLNGSI